MFAFFARPENLERITPGWLRFRITSPADAEITEGTELRYRLRIRGVPVTWISRIAVWEPPERFVDEQVRGPYRSWRHEHRFEVTGQGTRVLDDVAYEVPPGVWPLDVVLDRLLVRPDVERIFAHRRARIEELFEAESG